MTKRDEIARELAKELGILAFGEIQLPHGEITQILWDKFVDARARLAERDQGIELLKIALRHAVMSNHGFSPKGCSACGDIEDALAAPRKEPRNG